MGGRILVVDDDPTLRNSVARVLEDEGYAVDQATDGMEALRRIEENRPDAILLDVLMPRMNGTQLLETLSRDRKTAEIPVLVMTAMHGIDPHRTIQLGAEELVEKPFDVEELLNKVALALFRANEMGAPEPPPRQPPAGTEVSAAVGRAPSIGVVLLVASSGLVEMFDEPITTAGYTTVSVTRPSGDLPRLASALEPKVVVLDGDQPSQCLQALEHLAVTIAAGVPVVVVCPDNMSAEARSEVATRGAAIVGPGEAVDRVLADLRGA